jgi:hypothetical protein
LAKRYLVPVIEATGQPVDASDTLRKVRVRLNSAGFDFMNERQGEHYVNTLHLTHPTLQRHDSNITVQFLH